MATVQSNDGLSQVEYLDFSDDTLVDNFKKKVNLIYEGFRKRNILMPHSIYLPKEALLKALGVTRNQGGGLVEDNSNRTGVLMYVTSKVDIQDPVELLAKIFPDSTVNPNENTSHFSIAVVATNNALENFEANGANFVSSKECPPEVDCPPWHTAPQIQ